MFYHFIFFDGVQFAEFFHLQKVHRTRSKDTIFSENIFFSFWNYKVNYISISTLEKGLIHLTYVIFTKKKLSTFFCWKIWNEIFHNWSNCSLGPLLKCSKWKIFFFRNEKEENVVARKWVEDICFNSRSKKNISFLFLPETHDSDTLAYQKYVDFNNLKHSFLF